MDAAALAALCGTALFGLVRLLQRIQKRRQGDSTKATEIQRDARSISSSTEPMPLVKMVAKCEASWFLEDLDAAMGGDAEAMVRVGHMLLAGYGIRTDSSEAAKWLRQAWAIQNFKEPAERDAFLAQALDLPRSDVHALQRTTSTSEAPAEPAGGAGAYAGAAGTAGSGRAGAAALLGDDDASVSAEDGEDETDDEAGGGRHAALSGTRGGLLDERQLRSRGGASFSGAVCSGPMWGSPSAAGAAQRGRRRRAPRQRSTEACRGGAAAECHLLLEPGGGAELGGMHSELQALSDDSWFECLSDSYAAPGRIKRRPRPIGLRAATPALEQA